ncbi:MAG: hypothetical protein ACRDPM_12490 [Solirubrobacteraceae bacterium]
MSRLGFTALPAVLALLCTVALGASPALASSTAGHKRNPTTHRVGGKVHKAWPRRGKPPRSALARWLARQVGPTKVRACTKRRQGNVVKCHRFKPPRAGTPLPGGQLGRPKAHATAAAAAFMRLGKDINPIAYAASGSGSSPSTVSTGLTNLQLDRSYQIPSDDPSYTRLLNWSWTYDSAITALALTTFGAPSLGEELLDQLAALQHTDGSIELAFNVADGTTESEFRSGTIATMGLAGSIYDRSQHTGRYLAMEQRAASYLISLQGTSGLIRGGPDVGWYSTQHNLLAYAFLNQLGAELISDNQRSKANGYLNAADGISSGLESKLLVHNGSTAYFIEGLGDNVQSLDADALGVLYLVSRNETTVAQEVLSYAQSAFGVSGRSITKSTNAATYNSTYAASGPFSGFEPFLGSNAPDVLWTEGSAEMEVADAALGQPTATLNASLLSIYALTPTVAPLMADRTLTDPSYSAEFHVWPSDAAGAWFLLAQKRPVLFPKS